MVVLVCRPSRQIQDFSLTINRTWIGKMVHKLKIALAAAISLISGAAYATQLGNAILTEASGCDLTNSPPSPITGAITVGTATASNGHVMYYVTQSIGYNSAFGTGQPDNLIHFIFAFDTTAATYIVTAPGADTRIGASFNTLLSGNYTGSIAPNSTGGYAVSVTLGCGTRLVGTTQNTGT
jgi:hypothetical protein